MSKKSQFNNGQSDYSKSRADSTLAIIKSGGVGSGYNPPAKEPDRSEYQSGYRHSKNQTLKR